MNGKAELDVSEHAIKNKIKKAIDRKRLRCMGSELKTDLPLSDGLVFLRNHNVARVIWVP